MTEIKIGNALTKIIDVGKMFEIGQELLSKDPLAFLCNNENCSHCSEVRRQQKEK